MVWIYQNEEKLMCPHCDREQTILEEDLYVIGELNDQTHVCEHCGESFIWQINKLTFDSKVWY